MAFLRSLLLQTCLMSLLRMQAAEFSDWGTARRFLEQGLICSPENVLIAEKLLEVLLSISDLGAAAYIAHYLLQIHPFHPRASQLSILFRGLGDLIGINLPLKLKSEKQGC